MQEPDDIYPSKEEYARRGKEFYENAVLPRVEAGDKGKFVAIDIETGEYELDRDDYTAAERLFGRLPDARVWLARVGFRTAYQMI